ncbi:hypothetical protein ABIE77_006049 [Sinorhizobium fredii]
MRVGIGRKTDNADGAAMEIVGADDDLRLVGGDALDLISPFADRLYRRLDRLGAGIHWQHLVRAGEGGDLLVEQSELVVAEGARGERQLLRLLHHRLEDHRVAMALVDGRIGRQTVQIAVALDVPDEDAFAARQHDVERLVVVGAEQMFGLDQGCRGLHQSLSAMLARRRLGGGADRTILRRSGSDGQGCGGRRGLPSTQPGCGRSCRGRRGTGSVRRRRATRRGRCRKASP